MFTLPDEHRALHDATVRFARGLARDLPPGEAEFSRDVWKRCAQHGLLGLAMPAAWGGSATDALSAVVAFEALGYGCADNGLAFSLASQLTSCQIPIAHHASEAVRARYLPGLIAGDLIAAHAATEPDAGSDVHAVRTVARRVDGGYRLTGSKVFSTLAPVSDLAVVLARTGDAGGPLTEFVVPRTAYQVSRSIAKIGLRSAPMAEIILEDGFVPEDHVLGTAGSGLMRFMTVMEWERLVIMAPSVGAMARELERCVEYARTRTQFGQTIGSFQAVSHRLADMKLRLETSRLLLYAAAARKDATGRATMESALVKLHLSESRHASALDAVRTFGGYGVTEENGVERELRDAVPGLVYSGTSDIQRNTIARLLGL